MKKTFLFVAVLLLVMTILSATTYAETEDQIPLKVIDLGELESAQALMNQNVGGEGSYHSSVFQPEAEKELTIMVYLCGSDLEEYLQSASRDLVEMASSGFDEDTINVIVMTGGSRKWHIDSIPDRANAIYRVGNNCLQTILNDGKAYNMGDSATLAAFLTCGYELFPAKQYALILWDHGGGSLGGLCHDTNFGYSALSFYSLQEAFMKSPFSERKLDWIGFDACLMSAAEMAITVAPFADYMIASEEFEPAIGWDYSFLGDIKTGENPVDTGTRIADGYERCCKELVRSSGRSSGSITMACIDLAQVENVIQGIDDFFSKVDISQDNFLQMSVARRNLVSFGRSEETPENDNDLVDLGHTVQCFSAFGDTDDAAKVLEALQKCVCYSVPSESGYSGLSLYFPYYNTNRFYGRILMYQDLLFSDAYTSFIEDFGTHLLKKEDESWGMGQTNIDEAHKDNRTNISLSLTESQVEEADSDEIEIIAIQMAQEGEGWHLVATQKAELNKERGVVNGEYVHTNLFITDADDKPIWDLPILYYTLDDGSYSIPVIFADAFGERTQARLICSENAQNGYLLDITEIYLYDPAIEGYSPRLTGNLKDYKEIIYEIQDRNLTYNTNGSLLPFERWDAVGNPKEYSVSLDDEWKFMFVRDYIDSNTIYVAFKITDVFNAVHLSEPIPVVGKRTDYDSDIVYKYDYDDQKLVYIDSGSFFQDPSGLLVLSVMNLTDSEAEATLENISVNGKSTDLVIPIEGRAESKRLMPQETATAFVMLPLEDGDTVDTVTLYVVLRDEIGMKVGTVKVDVYCA